jgi:TolB protein
MSRQTFSSSRVLLLVSMLVFGVFAVLIWARSLATQPAISSSDLTLIATKAANALPFQMDPAVCSSQVYPAPQGVYLKYPATKVIGGGTVQNDDFTFQIYLYCDEALRADTPESFSEISGLGIYAKWVYNGPLLEGEFWDLYGIEPGVKRSTGFSNLSKGSSAGYNGGLVFPDASSNAWQVSELVKDGMPLQFSVKVQTRLMLYGARLSFKLAEGANGLIPMEIGVRALPVEMVMPEPTPTEFEQTVQFPPLQPAIHRYPTSNGFIAYVSSQDGNQEIYSMLPNGNQATNLTQDPANDTNPVWSPDGKRIAFISDRQGGAGDIYVMNADGSGVRMVFPNTYGSQAVTDQGNKTAPTISWMNWSPDGQFVLAEISRGSGVEKCMAVARVDGGGGICFNNLDFEGPQWSPDGAYISFIKGARNTSVTTLDAAMLLENDIRHEILISGSRGWREWPTAIWSPDGTRLAVYVMNETTEDFELWVVSVDGKEHRSLFKLGSNPWNRAPVIPPVWSPDSQQLAFVQNGDIKLAHAGGESVTTLVSAELYDTLKWSPDGRYLLFTAGNPRQIYTLDVSQALQKPELAQPVPLTSNPDSNASQADWQPILPLSIP